MEYKRTEWIPYETNVSAENLNLIEDNIGNLVSEHTLNKMEVEFLRIQSDELKAQTSDLITQSKELKAQADELTTRTKELNNLVENFPARQIVGDSEHRFVTDAQISSWDNKENAKHTHPINEITGLGTAATKNTGTASGDIPLIGSNGKLPYSILPEATTTDVYVVASQSEMLALDAKVGDMAIRTDVNKSFILKAADPSILSNWQELLTSSNTVNSVAGKTGNVVLDKHDVGLGNVTNESKTTMFTSPAFTGSPTAPTQVSTDNSTKLATTAFVKTVLNTKANTSDLTNHTENTTLHITDAERTAWNAKANASHTHTTANITDLQAKLDAKANTSHTHTIANITSLQSTLDSKADTNHKHSIEEVTDLQKTLNSIVENTTLHMNVDATTTAKGHVQLTNSISTDQTKAVTPKGVNDALTDIKNSINTKANQSDLTALSTKITDHETRTGSSKDFSILDKKISATGWYRIASNTGSRAFAEFQLVDKTSSKHSSAIFNAGAMYGKSATLTLLGYALYSTAPFTQVRILYKGTYDPVYIDVYVSVASGSSNTMSAYISKNNQDSGWVSESLAAASVPDGYSTKTFTIDANSVADATGKNTSLDTKNVNGVAASTITQKITTAESDISALKTADSTISGKVTAAETRITKTETDISALKTADTTITGKVTAAENRITKTETDISSLKSADTTLTNRIAAAETKITAAETKTGDLSKLTFGTKKDVATSLNELFQLASDGKTKIAAAITGKGVTTSASDTFDKMATNISNIKTGYGVGDKIKKENIGGSYSGVFSYTAHGGLSISFISADDDGNTYFANNFCRIYKLDPNGQLIWTYEGFTSPIQSISPWLTGGTLMACCSGGKIKKIDSSGSTVWTHTHPRGIGYRSLRQSTSYVYAADTAGNVIVALTGGEKILIDFPAHNIGINEIVIKGDGKLWSVCNEGYIKKYNVDSTWGKETLVLDWSEKIAYKVLSVAVDDLGNCYTTSENGYVTKYNDSGYQRWSRRPTTKPMQRVRVDDRNNVYCIDNTGTIYKYNSYGDHLITYTWKSTCTQTCISVDRDYVYAAGNKQQVEKIEEIYKVLG